MKILKSLNEGACTNILTDPERLAALAQTRQMNSGADEAFDRLTFLAAKLLKVPLTIVSFVGDDKQYFKSFHGLPEPWASQREIPIDVSVCQYTLVGSTLSLADAREHPLLSGSPAIPALSLVGYLGVPLLDDDGNNLGAFCAISNERREWSDDDIEVLQALTKSVMSEIKLKTKIRSLEKEKKDWETTIALLTHDIRSPLSTAYSFSEVAIDMDDSNVTKQALASIKRTTGETLQLVDQLLDWRKDSLMANDWGETACFDLLPDIKDILNDYSENNTLDFELNFSVSELLITGNRQSLKRAFRNLVSNAVKYGDLSQKISITLEYKKSLLQIKVHNFGEPIPPDSINNIFEIGKRSNLKTDKKSWGFGLAQVLSTAKAHFGTISVQSNAAMGTTFSLSIPVSAKKK